METVVMNKVFLKIWVLLSISVLFIANAKAQVMPPEYGLYWFKNNTDFKKASPNLSSDYYHPNRKTMIFAHGQQTNAIQNDFFESFDYKKHSQEGHAFPEKTERDLAKIWKDEGWNVGVFYWREFADDSVLEAESKVWSHRGIYGMRMKVKNADGSVSNIDKHNIPAEIVGRSVSDLFYDSYVDALANHGNNEIRLVGHSLGNQLVMATGKKISDAVASGQLTGNLHPDRVALLDPFYSNNLKPFWFFSTTGKKAAEAAAVMKSRGTLFELYRYSLVSAIGEIVGQFTNDKDSLLKLRLLSAHQDMRPWYINMIDIGEKHIASPYLYFKTMDFAPPAEVKFGKWVGPWYFRRWDPLYPVKTGDALSARTSNSRVKQMMTDAFYWEQVRGRQSANTVDDMFIKKRR